MYSETDLQFTIQSMETEEEKQTGGKSLETYTNLYFLNPFLASQIHEGAEGFKIYIKLCFFNYNLLYPNNKQIQGQEVALYEIR